MCKILVLWATPRSRSTVFERIMLERKDFQVTHEPFGRYYYFSTERRNNRAQNVEAKPEYDSEVIWKELLEKGAQFPVFMKELAYYIAHKVDKSFMAQCTNTFLIRHPRQMLPSLYDKWPDFTMEETSYAELYQLFVLAKELTGKIPVVIDADDLVKNPTTTMQAYCHAAGIQFLPKSLEWGTGSRPEFNWWEGGSWHDDVNQSNRVRKMPPKNYLSVSANDKLEQAYQYCLPYYEKMFTHRLRIEDV